MTELRDLTHLDGGMGRWWQRARERALELTQLWNRRSIGVPRSEETAPPQDPTVGLCLGPYGGTRGYGFFYERGAPVHTP